MNIENTTNIIEPNKFYILDFRKPLEPEVYRNFFYTLSEATKVIDIYLKYDLINFHPISGKNIIKHGLTLKKRVKWSYNRWEFKNHWSPCLNIPKYVYPDDRWNRRKKKTWRDIQRNRLKKEQENLENYSKNKDK